MNNRITKQLSGPDSPDCCDLAPVAPLGEEGQGEGCKEDLREDHPEQAAQPA